MSMPMSEGGSLDTMTESPPTAGGPEHGNLHWTWMRFWTLLLLTSQCAQATLAIGTKTKPTTIRAPPSLDLKPSFPMGTSMTPGLGNLRLGRGASSRWLERNL